MTEGEEKMTGREKKIDKDQYVGRRKIDLLRLRAKTTHKPSQPDRLVTQTFCRTEGRKRLVAGAASQ
jgi:hypothetical protein